MRKITIFISLLVFWSCDNDKGDKTAPEVTIISPESGSIVNEVVSITSEATDNNKIEFVQFFVNDSINYHSRAIVSSMPFLSPYIPELDSIRGDIDIILSLTGPAFAIMRDGSIEINNSRVYTMLINNPLINVDGKANMTMNKMNILYLNGASIKYPRQNFDNIKVSGAIDFTSFFEPVQTFYFSVQMTEKEQFVE